MKIVKNRGFSLAEVVVAVGVFAFAIVGIVGFIGAMGKQTTEVKNADEAARVISFIQNELQQQIDAKLINIGDIVNLVTYATQDGGIVDANIPNRNKFFKINTKRNEQISPEANDDTAGFLALIVNLEWPCYLPAADGIFVPEESRNVLLVPMVFLK